MNEKTEQQKHTDQVQPIDYLGGVMDEETRPLLKQYINSLKDGEAALVVFRLPKGSNPNLLLESDIKEIAGHEWAAVSGRTSSNESSPLTSENSKWQTLVENLSKEAQSLRLPNDMLRVGEHKIKAHDNHQICFGLISRDPKKPITAIRGIVHQQLNMGLNGDLLLHESDIITQSLINNNVFTAESGKQRPLHVMTYGAGGSAHTEVDPGRSAVSDGVIDIRSHIHPRSLINAFEEYLNKEPKISEEQKKDYLAKKLEIENKIKNEPNYAGIEITHDMAELAKLAAQTRGQTASDIKINRAAIGYYSEIAYASPTHGTTVIYRIGYNTPPEKPFINDDGHKQSLQQTRNLLHLMSNPEKQETLKKEIQTKARENTGEKYSEAVHAEIDAIDHKLSSAIEADRVLRNAIEEGRAFHNKIDPDHIIPYNITASGDIFFNEEDKKAVSAYGANMVEMENRLFLDIVHRSVVNGIYVEKQNITKIAADPFTIPKEITAKLNAWAVSKPKISADDYVAAFLWARDGQSFTNFPDCGLWQPAQEIYKDFPSKFYNFNVANGVEVTENPKIVNPYWKEIGTDFLKEISEGKAFTKEDKEKIPQGKIEELQKTAKYLSQDLSAPGIEKDLKKLVEAYFQAKGIVASEGTKYPIYSRSDSHVIEALHDWDQPIYKSSNTALLAVQANQFIQEREGKAAVTQGALISAPPNLEMRIQQERAHREEIEALKAAARNQQQAATQSPQPTPSIQSDAVSLTSSAPSTEKSPTQHISQPLSQPKETKSYQQKEPHSHQTKTAHHNTVRPISTKEYKHHVKELKDKMKQAEHHGPHERKKGPNNFGR